MKLNRLVSLSFISACSFFSVVNSHAAHLDPESTEFSRNFLLPFSNSALSKIPNRNGSKLNFASDQKEFIPLENQRLTSTLDAFFSQDTDKDTIWSVDIRAFSPSGQSYTVYQFHPQTPVRPASNMKLLTTWSAFHQIPELYDTSSRQYSQVYNMMKTSDNDAAEMVLKWLGGPQAIYDTFQQENLGHTAGMKVVDGSGLSYSNQVAASDLIQVLLSVYYSDYYKKFRAVLPIAGVDGTLATRPVTSHASVSAKTGTLTHNPDVALSGFANTDNGWLVIFSIVGDSIPDVDRSRATIDHAVDEVANTMRFYK